MPPASEFLAGSQIDAAYFKSRPGKIMSYLFQINHLSRFGGSTSGQQCVYVLYRDDHPYYIGKTKGRLFHRIWSHANASRDRYYNFWNYFSAFVVPDKRHIDEVEGVLIASTLTANNATPKIKRLYLPNEVARILRQRRVISSDNAKTFREIEKMFSRRLRSLQPAPRKYR